MSPSRPRLYLIDGYSNIFRAFFAIRGLSTSRGEPTNAVYGFLQMLRKLLREEDPELVGVALDVSEPTVRTEKFADYKANRPPMPEDLESQIPWIRKTIDAFRIPILELESYEADDVLGTLAKKAEAAGFDVVLVSADKDLMQLVTPHVSLYHTGRDRLYDPAGVEEDFGVPPAKVIDVLALQGDTSDNVPGVPGIGAKGAVQLIREFGSVEALLERSSEVGRKSYREGLEKHRDQALLSQELVTIHTDLPIELDPEALHHDPPDREALRDLARELEFFSLLKELEGDEIEAGTEPASEIETAEAWRELFVRLDGDVAVALLGDEAPRALAVRDSKGDGWLADLRRPDLASAVKECLVDALARPGIRWVGHDLKELLRLAGGRAPVHGRLFDLMLVSYVLRPEVHGHSLKEIALERLSLSLASLGGGKKEPSGDDLAVGSAALRAVAGERLAVIARLAGELETDLAASGMEAVYHDIEEPLVPVLVKMEETGILLDVSYLNDMSVELSAELEELENQIFELAGEEFNINSPQQLGVILFEKLGYPVIRRTKKTKSYATGAEVLEKLAEKGLPLPQKLLRFRELAKLKSTYVDALPTMVGADGRLHTRFNQAVAATGRLSSAHPNLQNIPVRTDLGQRIRRAFVAASGSVLLVADYSQIELRILAHIAQEGALVDAFLSGEDIHRATAARVLGVAPELVTAEQRRAAKVINFGILYGMSPFGLAKNLGISTAEAERFIRSYFERYPAIEHYMEETLASAEKEGRVETLFGRVRWLPDLASKNRNLRENARRMAINARIQGTAADLLKKAMISLDRVLSEKHPEARLLLTVHDELVLEV
ncbi:MAG TPA: DNA polymerase I, partial [Thermoanaerobaculia bacterium]|nr:DNA polymerase I [Thermoanaerobaculia bacterium]